MSAAEALRPAGRLPVPASEAPLSAQAVGRDGSLIDDFVVSGTRRTIHVRNAPSPAATSALALASHIVDELEHQLGP